MEFDTEDQVLFYVFLLYKLQIATKMQYKFIFPLFRGSGEQNKTFIEKKIGEDRKKYQFSIHFINRCFGPLSFFNQDFLEPKTKKCQTI